MSGHIPMAAVLAVEIVSGQEGSENSTIETPNLHQKVGELIKPYASKHSAKVLTTTSNGFVLTFTSSAAAVDCALEIQDQTRLLNDRFSPDGAASLRMGIHFAEVTEETQSASVEAPAFKTAQRVASMADPGRICITESVYRQIVRRKKIGWKPATRDSVNPLPDDIRVWKMADDPKLTRTILFSDIVGWSQLVADNQEKALTLRNILENEIIQPTSQRYSRKVYRRLGDGFLLTFADSVQAVHCAVEIQKQMKDFRPPDGGRIQLRIGSDSGLVVEDRRGNDVDGHAVNMAQRIQTAAPEGGLCISETVYQHISPHLKYRWKLSETSGPKPLGRDIQIWELVSDPKIIEGPPLIDRRSIIIPALFLILIAATGVLLITPSNPESSARNPTHSGKNAAIAVTERTPSAETKADKTYAQPQETPITTVPAAFTNPSSGRNATGILAPIDTPARAVAAGRTNAPTLAPIRERASRSMKMAVAALSKTAIDPKLLADITQALSSIQVSFGFGGYGYYVSEDKNSGQVWRSVYNVQKGGEVPVLCTLLPDTIANPTNAWKTITFLKYSLRTPEGKPFATNVVHLLGAHGLGRERFIQRESLSLIKEASTSLTDKCDALILAIPTADDRLLRDLLFSLTEFSRGSEQMDLTRTTILEALPRTDWYSGGDREVLDALLTMTPPDKREEVRSHLLGRFYDLNPNASPSYIATIASITPIAKRDETAELFLSQIERIAPAHILPTIREWNYRAAIGKLRNALITAGPQQAIAIVDLLAEWDDSASASLVRDVIERIRYGNEYLYLDPLAKGLFRIEGGATSGSYLAEVLLLASPPTQVHLLRNSFAKFKEKPITEAIQKLAEESPIEEVKKAARAAIAR